MQAAVAVPVTAEYSVSSTAFQPAAGAALINAISAAALRCSADAMRRKPRVPLIRILLPGQCPNRVKIACAGQGRFLDSGFQPQTGSIVRG